MGQEESSGGTLSDLSDTTKFNSENQLEQSSFDIYSRQNDSYQIMYDNYVRKCKPTESDQLFVDSFYIEILKKYNQKILAKKTDDINNFEKHNLLKKHSQPQLPKSEIENLDHDTNEIYDHTLPALNAQINNIKKLIEIKQGSDSTESPY